MRYAGGIRAALGALLLSSTALRAQDLTGVPAAATLERLAAAVGAASRREAIVALDRALDCDPSSPALDSAAVAMCATLAPVDAARLLAEFARGLGRAPDAVWPRDPSRDLPLCDDADGKAEGESSRRARGEPSSRGRYARIGAPVVGARDGKWEGRITLELDCRAGTTEGPFVVRTIAKEYLCQWDGRAWKLYQVASRRITG